MILEELSGLADYTNAKIGYNSWFGDRDPGADEYPVIRYLTDEGTIFTLNTKSVTSLITVNCEIITKKENELDCWQVYETWLKKILQYNDEKGHEILEDFEVERGDSIFKIIIKLNVRLIVQDTE